MRSKANKSIETINWNVENEKQKKKINQISMQNETWSNLINAQHQQSIKGTRSERITREGNRKTIRGAHLQ